MNHPDTELEPQRDRIPAVVRIIGGIAILTAFVTYTALALTLRGRG